MRCKILTIVLGCVLAAGCAKQAGESAVRGAANEVREQAQHPEQGPPPFEIGSKNMVIGALNELDKPERQAQVARIVGAMMRGALMSAEGNTTHGFGWGGGPPASGGFSMPPAQPFPADARPMTVLGDRFSEGFTLGMSKQLQAELGSAGDGPLAKSLETVTEHMSQAAATGFAQGLTPELGDCAGADRSQCTERRVQQLSRSAAVGFAEGLGTTFRIPFLIVGFVIGLVVAFVFFGLVRLARPRAHA
jgi:hypothetical protein